MFESAYKNKGLVNFMFKSISIIAIRLLKYSDFACSPSRNVANAPYAPSQIGFESSGGEKCSQKFEIDHFC